MIRLILLAMLLACPIAFAADDTRFSQLEQDVRDLQRQMQVLSRLVESLPATVPVAAGPVARPVEAPRAAVPAWLDAVKWRKVRPGMGELEVLGILGPPTSMRMRQTDRVLLYALEIGASGFLGGSVTIRDRSVVSVESPTLR